MSPSPEHVEYAETLLRLAEADLHACRVLAGHDDVADGAVGFHAQQAVEKALKTAIVAERLAELSSWVERLARVIRPSYIPVWLSKPVPPCS